MKLLMISDLHICGITDSYLKRIYLRIDRVFEVINREVVFKDHLVVVMCGDVVDCGDRSYYSSAEKIFDYMREKAKVQQLDVEFVMIPGNHDLCDNSFHAFDMFCKKYQCDAGEFELGSCYSKKVEDINFILANSAFHKDYNYGKVEADEIRKCADPNACNILLTHHSPMSEDENDTAAIREMPRLLDVINEQHIKYHLHGHTHGTYWTKIGYDCYSLGVGAMFQAAGEMGSQFHLITIRGNEICEAKNYYYFIDRGKYIETDIDIQGPQRAEAAEVSKGQDHTDCGNSNNEADRNNIGNEAFELSDDIAFQPPEAYITRMAGPFDIVQRGGIELLYNREEIMPLAEILSTKKRIVLIGAAGSGKSYELQNLTFELAKNRAGIPVFICLDDYVDETIEAIVTVEIGCELRPEHVLIFDAYDEIEDQRLGTFARRLNAFVKKHPKQRIVISTRNNFYRNALDETTGGTFRDFYECSLCPLTEQDINAYLDSRGIDRDSFMEEVRVRKLKEQLFSPFFLVQIVGLYEHEDSLPVLNQLMDKLIDISLEKDDQQYLLTANIYEQKKEIIRAMQTLAFSMQCLKKNSLESDEYQELLDSRSRDFMKYCGLWKKSGNNKWQFQHNNFREYLAACFLKQKTLEQIIQLVTYEEDRKRIKASWVNVLSFLIMIYPHDSLLQWMMEVSPSMVVKFEAARLSDEYRTRIFCAVFEEYKQANIWISWNENDVEELARFGQTGESIDYLIAETGETEFFRAQSNAIHLLGKMTDFHGRESAVQAALLDCCFCKNTRNYEIKAAILALMNPALYDETNMEKLLAYFADEADSEIRYALYCYIIEYHLQEAALDFVLKGLAYTYRSDDNYQTNLRMKDILKSLDTYESIHKVFDYILNAEDYHEVMHSLNDVFEELCVTAEKLYKMGDVQLQEDMPRLFIQASCHYETRPMKAAKQYLEHTDQIFSTYERILTEAHDEHIVYMLEDIMDEACMDDFADKYEKGLLGSDDWFVQYVSRRLKGSYRYEEFRELIYQKEGLVLEEREMIDYNSLRVDGVRRYFNALFDQHTFQKLVEELACLCRGDETTYEDLKGISYRRTVKRFDLDKVKWAICRNNFEDRSIINFVSIVDWESFSIANICEEIMHEPDISVTWKQEEYIREYCLTTIGDIDFDNEISYMKDGTVSSSSRLIWCAYFANCFSIDYDRDILLNMLRVPAGIFGHKDSASVLFADYVTSRLDEESIRKQVCDDLKNRKIEGELAETYIRYCTEKEILEAFELADSVIRDRDYCEWIREIAIKYMLAVKGTAFVIENYLADADGALLQFLAGELAASGNSQLLERLIEENKASEDGMAYLHLLIQMESDYGLQKYYELAEKGNAIPDLSADDNIATVTEAIGEISEIKHLDIIIKLAGLATREGFHDHRFFGLYNSVGKAIRNMAQNAPQIVIQRLEEAKADENCSHEFVSFCNYYLLEIRTQYYNAKDSAWSIEKVKKYVIGV